jgi:hypothetical protein
MIPIPCTPVVEGFVFPRIADGAFADERESHDLPESKYELGNNKAVAPNGLQLLRFRKDMFFFLDLFLIYEGTWMAGAGRMPELVQCPSLYLLNFRRRKT